MSAPADDELRIVRRAAFFALLLTAGCPASTPPPKAPASNEPVRAEVLFERHLRAVGGSRAIEKLTGATLAFSIAYPDRGVEGTGQLALSVEGPAQLALDLEGIGKIEKTYEDGWASDLRFDVHLAQHYTAAKTIGSSEVDGIAVWEVEAKGPTGPVTLSFDKSAGVLLALRGEVETPEGRQTTSSRFADYQDFGGIRCARRITQRTGERVQVIEVRSIDRE